MVTKPNFKYEPDGVKLKEIPEHFLSVYNTKNIKQGPIAGPLSLNHMKSIDQISLDPDSNKIWLLDSTFGLIAAINEEELFNSK